jgi:PAS domain S-box-containing protein
VHAQNADFGTTNRVDGGDLSGMEKRRVYSRIMGSVSSEDNTVTYRKPQQVDSGKGSGSGWMDLDHWREPRGSKAIGLGLAVLGGIAAVDGVVYVSGGTVYVWAHLMYLPIILAAAGFRIYGGVAAALIGRLSLGPLMPLDVAAGLPQTTSNWMFRVGFFILVGGFSGLIARVFNTQISRIKRREEHIHYILNNTKEAIFQTDLSGNYIYGNHASEQLTGYPLAQLLQMNMLQLTALEFHPVIEERLLNRSMLNRSMLNRSMLNSSTLSGSMQSGSNNGLDEKAFEIALRHKDGHPVWAELTTRKVFDREHNWIAVQGVARDITERKNLERSLRQSNRVYAVLSGINELIVREKNLQAMFEGACRIAVEEGKFSLAWVGLIKDPHEPIQLAAQAGATIQLAAHAGASAETLAVLQKVFTDPALGCAFTKRALETGGHAVCNDVAKAPEAAAWRELALERGYRSLVSLPLSMRGRRAGVMNIYAGETGFFDAGELRLLDSLAADISFALEVNEQEIERRQLEEQVRQVQKMECIGQLAGGVAHDFNNILAVIQIQTEHLKSIGSLSPVQAEIVEDISTATQRATALTRQLLTFSRKQTMQAQDLDVNEAIRSLTKMLRPILSEKIQMQFKCGSENLWVHADAIMLDQVLMNLAINSRDAMPEGGQLVIETSAVEFDERGAAQSAKRRAGSLVCVAVSDTGQGIPPENLAQIFEPFFTTKEAGKGTGLGLATVFGIVRQHEGWVEVTSEVGRGTTFRIFLPRSR